MNRANFLAGVINVVFSGLSGMGPAALDSQKCNLGSHYSETLWQTPWSFWLFFPKNNSPICFWNSSVFKVGLPFFLGSCYLRNVSSKPFWIQGFSCTALWILFLILPKATGEKYRWASQIKDSNSVLCLGTELIAAGTKPQPMGQNCYLQNAFAIRRGAYCGTVFSFQLIFLQSSTEQLFLLPLTPASSVPGFPGRTAALPDFARRLAGKLRWCHSER